MLTVVLHTGAMSVLDLTTSTHVLTMLLAIVEGGSVETALSALQPVYPAQPRHHHSKLIFALTCDLPRKELG